MNSDKEIKELLSVPSINLSNEEKYVKLRIEIIDSGVGIKKEDLPKLFMEFGKLDEHSKMNAQGTGLGLNICKRMIEQMGGEVKVDSIYGKGSTFTININTRGKIEPKNNNSSHHRQGIA